MKIDKKDRERLYKSKGKTIRIEWPLEYAPRRGQRHPVHGDSGERVFSIRVEGVIWREGCALVKMDDDPIRILPGLGVDEPERVHHSYEDLLAAEGEAKTALCGAERREDESVNRLLAKRAEAVRLNKPGRCKNLESRISRKSV